jgi:hypothetical protein
MRAPVFFSRQQCKILRTVVQLVAVPVMHVLARQQPTAKHLLNS